MTTGHVEYHRWATVGVDHPVLMLRRDYPIGARHEKEGGTVASRCIGE
jgi:hypothetical protein